MDDNDRAVGVLDALITHRAEYQLPEAASSSAADHQELSRSACHGEHERRWPLDNLTPRHHRGMPCRNQTDRVVHDRLPRREVGRAGHVPGRLTLWPAHLSNHDPQDRSPSPRFVCCPFQGQPGVLRAVDAYHHGPLVAFAP
jgi:hypothetical protein